MHKLRLKYEKRFLIYELILSILFIGLFILFIDKNSSTNTLLSILDESREALYTSIASISGAILGFIIAGVSIIFVLVGNEKLGRVTESNKYKDIYKTYLSAIKYLAISTFSAVLGILLDKDTDPNIWIFYLNLWAVIISTFRVWRCVWILENIIELITENDKT